jgi:hypothetical protein
MFEKQHLSPMNADSLNIFQPLSPKFIHSPINSHIIASKLLLRKINTTNALFKPQSNTERKRRLFQLGMQTNNGHTTLQRDAYMNLKQENLRISCANIHSLACNVCVFAATMNMNRQRRERERETQGTADRLAKKTLRALIILQPLHCLDVYKVLAPFVCLRRGKMLRVW